MSGVAQTFQSKQSKASLTNRSKFWETSEHSIQRVSCYAWWYSYELRIIECLTVQSIAPMHAPWQTSLQPHHCGVSWRFAHPLDLRTPVSHFTRMISNDWCHSHGSHYVAVVLPMKWIEGTQLERRLRWISGFVYQRPILIFYRQINSCFVLPGICYKCAGELLVC